jgi:hypothetical protein
MPGQDQTISYWVIPEKIHTPPTEEISAVRRGRGEKMFLIRVSVLGNPKGVGGFNIQFPLWERYGCFLERPIILKIVITGRS